MGASLTYFFLFSVTEGCDLNRRTPAACFSLQLPSDLDFENIRSAELWLYKRADVFDSHNQTFVISEMAHWDTKHSFPRIQPIAILETATEGKSPSPFLSQFVIV